MGWECPGLNESDAGSNEETCVPDNKKPMSLESFGNRYETVLMGARRCRQLLDRAEKHGMSADVTKVIGQAMDEILTGKVKMTMPPPESPVTTGRKKSKEKVEA
jgi:DNA-directed RNA polymerase subunit K/omega